MHSIMTSGKRALRNLTQTGAIITLLAACAGLAPRHTIPVNPDFVLAGVVAGDVIEIVLISGQSHRLKVTDVTSTMIHAEDRTFRISDIHSISKRSWTPPDNPCGGGKPVGCSIPPLVSVLSDFADETVDEFHGACVVHDYCYRHGSATYGLNQENCDDEFLENMKAECRGPAGLNLLDVKEFAECELIARQVHGIVRTHGAQYFQSSASSHCEYKLLEMPR